MKSEVKQRRGKWRNDGENYETAEKFMKRRRKIWNDKWSNEEGNYEMTNEIMTWGVRWRGGKRREITEENMQWVVESNKEENNEMTEKMTNDGWNYDMRSENGEVTEEIMKWRAKVL